ncbi:hypothetical protein [Paludibaculum fermentans]|uniref:Uncharacterized protein n=1 Tax=Paludibaculum fermentans TaxID=1473598 RepID=A0A7S7SJT9_PALFE|nr:hypothetical protein [Paludibaculum fermentans]QOY86781.1 hypothetical protein IRI77_28960 [Paludibaculum fermentans]
MAATKVSYFYQKVLSKTLKCSQVLDMLMEQPTSAETSHAHLHTCDGFRLDPAKITVNVLGLPVDQLRQQKEREWAYDSHLFPGAGNALTRYQPGAYHGLDLNTRKSQVMQDASRLPLSNQYNERTGLGILPGIDPTFGVRYYIKKFPPGGKGKPLDVDIAGPGAIGALNAADYVCEHGVIKIFQGRGAQLTAAVPMVPAKSTHTMFEDSESMVMHLTAALLSEAGLAVLKTLKERGHNGGTTVGIFSKTAVLAVARHFQNVANQKNVAYDAAQTLDRKSDTNPLNRRQLTGTFTKSTQAIDHVVVVLACSLLNDLVVVTCYPSPATTQATIGTATRDGEDIAEHTFGQHTKMPRQASLPTLSW